MEKVLLPWGPDEGISDIRCSLTSDLSVHSLQKSF